MARDEADATIRFRTTADVSGARAVGDAIGKVTGVVGKFRAVLAGLGVAGVFTALLGQVKAVRESFGKAQAEAERFARAQADAARAKEIDALAESYARLAKSIGDAAAANEHQLAMISKSAAAQRELEDAQARAAEQGELAAVDPDDPAAAERRAAIRAKYAGQASERAALRGEQDVEAHSRELTSQAEQLYGAATKNRFAAGEDADMIARLEDRRKAALARAVSENGRDATTSFSMFAKNVKDIATLNWGGVGDSRTEEGDAVRAEAQAEAERLQGQIDELKKARLAKLQAAADAETQAGRKMDEAGIEMSRLDAARLNREAAGTAARTQNTAAQNALDTREAKAAAAPGRLAGMRARLADYRGQIASAEENASVQALEAAQAQAQLDAFNASVGTRRTGVARERAGLQANLDRETEEAREARRAAASLKSNLAELITALKAEIRSLESEVKSARSRIAFNASEGGS